MTDLRSPASGWPMNLADFCATFEPPHFVVDRLLQRGGLYSLTGKIGSGKTAIALNLAASVALGTTFGGRLTTRGKVLYLAGGEITSDVTARWAAQRTACAGSTPGGEERVSLVPGRFDLAKNFENLRLEVAAMGGVDLVIVDNASAFFPITPTGSGWPNWSDATVLRRLSKLDGHPCVVATCYRPRIEVGFDGHLKCSKRKQSDVVRLAPASRPTFWTPDIEPIDFKLESVSDGPILDSRGRSVPTVIAVAAEAADQGSVSVQRRS